MPAGVKRPFEERAAALKAKMDAPPPIRVCRHCSAPALPHVSLLVCREHFNARNRETYWKNPERKRKWNREYFRRKANEAATRTE